MPDRKKFVAPGIWFREQYLKPSGMTVTAAAERLGISRQTFSAFINGRRGITTRLAARLAVVFNVSAEELLDRQAAFQPTVSQKTRSRRRSPSLCAAVFKHQSGGLGALG